MRQWTPRLPPWLLTDFVRRFAAVTATVPGARGSREPTILELPSDRVPDVPETGLEVNEEGD